MLELSSTLSSHVQFLLQPLTEANADSVFRELCQIVASLIPHLDHKFTLIRSTSCRTLSQFSKYIVQDSGNKKGYEQFDMVLTAFLQRISDTNKLVQGATCSALAILEEVVRLLILPNLEAYLQLLEPEIKRHEAWCVYGALLRAAGLCMYGRFKMFPSLLAPPTRPVCKSNNKVATNKRKASTNALMQQQPPAKKITTESSIDGGVYGKGEGASNQFTN
ncbi:hypothetical protein GOBAR_DD27897 [Gossypium barbadense]|nr:hypothetical protein GOBAR_DD27897 [Gossypium barbadense]